MVFQGSGSTKGLALLSSWGRSLGNGIWEIREGMRTQKPQDLLANTGARESTYGFLVTHPEASCDVLVMRICDLKKVLFFRLN